MSKHLSECFASLCECDDTHCKSTDCDFNCICPSLRACEQRVLDAAREAVERVSTLFEPLGPALAAIDALREKP